MNSRQASLVAALGLTLCACGNYSNDDLDFQLALPEQSDIEAKMQLSVTRADSAEYYRDTRSAIATFNAMVEKLTGLIDVVRGNVPSSRNGDERIWGPWPADQLGWQIRVVMRRSAVSSTVLHVDYDVQVRPQGSDDSAWADFLTGWYESSSGDTRAGQGEIQLLVGNARDAGFPLDADPGLAELVRVDIAYNHASYPISETLYIEKLPTLATTSGRLDYLQNEDGSGRLSFDWAGKSDAGTAITARMDSRWIGSGAGRADLTADLTPNRTGVETTLGIDCWGTDTVATYSYRIGGDPFAGDQTSCLF
jgi:hypothetical protein